MNFQHFGTSNALAHNVNFWIIYSACSIWVKKVSLCFTLPSLYMNFSHKHSSLHNDTCFPFLRLVASLLLTCSSSLGSSGLCWVTLPGLCQGGSKRCSLLPESDGWSRCWVLLLFQIGGRAEKRTLSWSLQFFLGCKICPSTKAGTKSISETRRGEDFLKLTHRKVHTGATTAMSFRRTWCEPASCVGEGDQMPG